MSNIEKVRAEIKRISSRAMNEDGQDICEYLLSLMDSLPNEEPSKDLEEAAEEYRRKSCNAALKPNIDGPTPEYGGNVKDAFIAGAKWQENHAPLPEDSVAFNNGVEEGKRLIMEEAVEGEIGYWNQRGLSIRLDKSLERLGYDMDTKVRIVIVKKKEEET